MVVLARRFFILTMVHASETELVTRAVEGLTREADTDPALTAGSTALTIVVIVLTSAPLEFPAAEALLRADAIDMRWVCRDSSTQSTSSRIRMLRVQRGLS